MQAQAVETKLNILEGLREAASAGRLTRSEALYWVRVASRAGLKAYDSNKLDRAMELFQFAADFIRFAIR